MIVRAHFGVIETPWELEIAPPASTDPSAEHHFTSSAPASPSGRFELQNVPDAMIVYAQKPLIFTITGSDAGTRREVTTLELVTKYTLPDGRMLFTSEYSPPIESAVIVRVANGMCHRVTLRTGPALVVEGHWQQYPGETSVRWDPTGGATLLTVIEDQAFAIEAPGFTMDEIVGHGSDLRRVHSR